MKSFLFAIILILLPSMGLSKTFKICPQLKIESPEKINFSANEKRLLCGDPKVKAWQTLPPFQVKTHVKSFLQERGYYQIQFSKIEDVLIVHTGQWTNIISIEPSGEIPKGFEISRQRKFIGQRLTPKILTSIEDWVRGELLRLGYACPQTSVTADGKTGIVRLNIDKIEKQYIRSVIEEPIADLNPGVLRRFDAFQIGDLYNGQRVTLTTRRAQSDGIVQNINFLHECTETGVLLKQKTIPGPKRLFITGFGANTEGAILGKASLKFSRIDRMGSSLQFSTFASFRKQVADVDASWYLLPNPSRWYLNPFIRFRREDEPQYELIATDYRLAPAVSIDTRNHHFHLLVGPQFTLTQTYEGAARGLTRFLSGIFQVTVTTHDFEFYRNKPRTGYTLTFKTSLNHENLLSSVTAQQLELSGSFLWDVFNFDPSILVVGLRGNLATTVADTNNPNIGQLPADFRYFQGGSANLRGFKLGELPNASLGALTAAYLGLETRLVAVLPWQLEPILFVDAGALGHTSFDFDNPLYWSPGGGLRWDSPVGVIRGTIAHGFTHGNFAATNDLTHWQYYFSFGEEF